MTLLAPKMLYSKYKYNKRLGLSNSNKESVYLLNSESKNSLGIPLKNNLKDNWNVGLPMRHLVYSVFVRKPRGCIAYSE